MGLGHSGEFNILISEFILSHSILSQVFYRVEQEDLTSVVEKSKQSLKFHLLRLNKLNINIYSFVIFSVLTQFREVFLYSLSMDPGGGGVVMHPAGVSTLSNMAIMSPIRSNSFNFTQKEKRMVISKIIDFRHNVTDFVREFNSQSLSRDQSIEFINNLSTSLLDINNFIRNMNEFVPTMIVNSNHNNNEAINCAGESGVKPEQITMNLLKEYSTQIDMDLLKENFAQIDMEAELEESKVEQISCNNSQWHNYSNSWNNNTWNSKNKWKQHNKWKNYNNQQPTSSKVTRSTDGLDTKTEPTNAGDLTWYADAVKIPKNNSTEKLVQFDMEIEEEGIAEENIAVDPPEKNFNSVDMEKNFNSVDMDVEPEELKIGQNSSNNNQWHNNSNSWNNNNTWKSKNTWKQWNNWKTYNDTQSNNNTVAAEDNKDAEVAVKTINASGDKAVAGIDPTAPNQKETTMDLETRFLKLENLVTNFILKKCQ